MASLLDEPGGVCSVSPSRTSRLASVTTASGRRSSISAMAALFQARQSGSSGFTSDTVENGQAPAHDRDQLPAVAAGGRDQCAGELLQVRVADQHDALGRLLLDRLGAAAHREAGHRGAVPALGAHPSRPGAAAQGHGSVTSQS
jgi:hypothetical protein